MEMELQVWCGIFLYLLSLTKASDYEYSYNVFRDGYDPESYVHGDYPRDWNKDWSRTQRPKCIDIPPSLTLCQNIGYDSMRLPNLLDHDTISEVSQQARSWVPLLGIHCHPDAQLFLCSLFSPVCLERTIWPCRSLCESVKNACLHRMKYYDFDWPEMLKCDKFPVDNDLCIKQQNYNVADNNCSVCKNPMTYEAIIDNYCRSADLVMRTTVIETQKVLSNLVIILKKKKKVYKKGISLTKKEKSTMSVVVEEGSNCLCDIKNNTGNKYLMMVKKKNNDFVLTFVLPWSKKDKGFKKAVKHIKQGYKCDMIKNEFIGVPSEMPTQVTTPKPRKSKRKKTKKGKRGKKGRKGRKKGKKGKRNKKRDKKSRHRKRRPRKNRKNEAVLNQESQHSNKP